MTADLTTRALLTAILLCLVLLAWRQDRGPEADAGAAGEPAAGRYVLLPTRVRGRPVLLRGDTVTGEMWRAVEIFADPHWTPLPPALPSAPAEGETAPADGGAEAPESGAAGDSARGLAMVAAAISPESPKDMRLWAVQQLGEPDYAAADAVPLLVQALAQSEPEVIIAAVEGLQRREAATSVGAMRPLLEHPDPGVRAAARAAIESFDRAARGPE